MSWIHGDYTIFGEPIEVLQVMHMRRGMKPRPGGWRARLTLSATVEITTTTYETREAAQNALRGAIQAALTKEF